MAPSSAGMLAGRPTISHRASANPVDYSAAGPPSSSFYGPYLVGRRLHGLSIDDNLVTMSWRDRDPAEVLLDLDGQLFVVDAKGGYWVRFSVNRIASTP